MKMSRKFKNKQKLGRTVCMIFALLLVFGIYLAWACSQRHNFSPDEGMRSRIVQYIYEHGKLPHGGDPEIRDEDWGISYAFNPILSYMISALFMKITSFFTTDEWALLISARMVNVLFGTASAYCIFKIGEALFKKGERVMFFFLCTLLPGAAILYTYINCDGLALFSSSFIIYMWVRAMNEGWTKKNSILLGVALSLCALSYYDAYGYALCSILFFVVSSLGYGKKKPDFKLMFKRGLLITAVVAVLAGWWFVRNYIIYDGDFLARKTMHEYAVKYAKPQFNPKNVTTFKDYPEANILSMLKYHAPGFKYRWIGMVVYGVVGIFGYNQIFLGKKVYYPYFALILVGLVFVIWKARDIFYLKREQVMLEKKINEEETVEQVLIRQKGIRPQGLFHLCLLLGMIIPNVLNLYYSYTSDYQPQGRYSMPMLVPMMYFVTMGYSRVADHFIKNQKLKQLCYYLVSIGTIVVALFLWARVLYPLYFQNYNGLH